MVRWIKLSNWVFHIIPERNCANSCLYKTVLVCSECLDPSCNTSLMIQWPLSAGSSWPSCIGWQLLSCWPGIIWPPIRPQSRRPASVSQHPPLQSACQRWEASDPSFCHIGLKRLKAFCLLTTFFFHVHIFKKLLQCANTVMLSSSFLSFQRILFKCMLCAPDSFYFYFKSCTVEWKINLSPSPNWFPSLVPTCNNSHYGVLAVYVWVKHTAPSFQSLQYQNNPHTNTHTPSVWILMLHTPDPNFTSVAFACQKEASGFCWFAWWITGLFVTLHKNMEALLKITQMRELGRKPPQKNEPSKHIVASRAFCWCLSGHLCLPYVRVWISICNRITNVSFFFFFLVSFFREKQDGPSCPTPTARTPRETKQILCLGRTGADGAPGLRGRGERQPSRRGKAATGEPRSPASDRRPPRRGWWQRPGWTAQSLTICRAAAATSAWTERQRCKPPGSPGSPGAWTARTRRPTVTSCRNVTSWARTHCRLCTAPGRSSAGRRSPTSCANIRRGSSCRKRCPSSAPNSVRSRLRSQDFTLWLQLSSILVISELID